MSEFTYLMARHEGLNRCDTAAILRISVTNPVAPSYSAAFERFRDAVTQWVHTTEEGREAWEASVADLNIGDMLTYGHFDEKSLQDILAKHGVKVESAQSLIFDQQREYDTVLAGGEVVCADCDQTFGLYECLSSTGPKWHCGCRKEGA